MNFVIGGCVYRSMVHTAHSQSVLSFFAAQWMSGTEDSTAVEYRHTSNLPQGRSWWLREAMGAKYRPDVAITVDSDTSFSGGALLAELYHLGHSPTWAIAVAPVIRNNEPLGLNVYHAPGESLAPSACGGGRPELWAGGFGLAAFNLHWFRENWLPHPEAFGESEDWINQGEDIQLCRSVAKRGGRILPIWVPTTHYDCSGAHIVGASVKYKNGRMVA